jgi:DNA invertase Pin-like site-specific DNA recombinase
MRRYVVYLRVSSQEQGKSGLGLEAQERDIDIFLDKFSDAPFEVIGRFQDIQSGADNSRPELDKALAMVRKTGAELLVAKLDRLSRKVSFIATLMDDAKVKLRVASMPNADKFSLHIYASLAEQERTFISERTKAALRMAKERGVKLGGMRDATMKRNVAIRVRADADADRLMKVIGPMRKAEQTLNSIAKALTAQCISTPRGGEWTAKQVSRVIERHSAA